VQDVADENSASRVLSIRVRIGEFSGVEPDLLSSAYDDLVQDTPLCGAALNMEQVPLEAVCEQCGNKFRIERFHFQCDKCGSLRLSLRGGEELLLESVTFEETRIMSRNLLTQTLQEIQFLQDMAPEHLEQIANIAQIRDFDEYDVVFREGQPADHMYLVVFGNVSLEICASGIGCKQISTLGPGELLGWSSLLDQSCYTARARTPQSARLVEINVALLMKICGRDPKFGYELMRRTAVALAKRLSATRMQLLNVYGEHLPAAPHDVEAG
jgi:hydrogenase nickel insertion protein HypA